VKPTVAPAFFQTLGVPVTVSAAPPPATLKYVIGNPWPMVAVMERVPSLHDGVTVQSDHPSTLTTGAASPVIPATKSWLYV
jgi:hypothetical protein